MKSPHKEQLLVSMLAFPALCFERRDGKLSVVNVH